MICNNKHCWRCQKVHKKDAEMALEGFFPYDMGELGRVYIKIKTLRFKKFGKIVAMGTGGGSNPNG